MTFTDFFIKRPILATVISLFILSMGIRSILSLPVMQYPFIEKAVVTVTTVYTGASSSEIAGFMTTPLENAVAQANGIDYITSSSTPSTSTITANLVMNYDPYKALSEITSQVNSVLNQLPIASQRPQITVSTGESVHSMYIGFYSETLADNEITDYLTRDVQPMLQAVDGVQNAQIMGGQTFALRAWLDPVKLAGYGISASAINAALTNNDFLSALGRTDGSTVIQNLTARTNLETVDEFKGLVVKAKDGAIIHLSDLAKVDIGAQNYDSYVSYNDQKAVYIAIVAAPSANIMTVLSDIKKLLPGIEARLPQGMKAVIDYDASLFVRASIKGVLYALMEALLIVAVVIFIFLGSFRSVIIPVIAIPLSIIGVFFVMLILGYSINLLTLLALVLAIGLVVDDAIIVVENVQRYINEGMSSRDASLLGARELANPIVAITIVVIAVYIPIGFMGGLTGALFTEFAFTLAGTVAISALIALTLSPMMCSTFLNTQGHERRNWFNVDRFVEKILRWYENALAHTLNYLPVVGVFAAIVLASNFVLFATSQTELAPQEDKGLLIIEIEAPANASLAQTRLYSKQSYDIIKKYPEIDHAFQIVGLNNAMIGMVLKPWGQRVRTTNQLQPLVQEELNKIAGAKIAVYQEPPLPGGGGGAPIQFVITTADKFENLNKVSELFLEKVRATGLFAYADSDLKIDQLQSTVLFDREKASQFGLTMQDLSNVLSTALSEGYINYFNYAGRPYQVIPQVTHTQRLNTEQLLNYYITLPSGASIPLSTIATLKKEVVPEALNHFQQRNSSTISAVPITGVSMGRALDTLATMAQDLPQGYTTDYGAESRQFVHSGSRVILTFFFALLIIFLSLAALFESFRDPLIVLISVPMSICGAMIFVSLGVGGMTLNIYSEIGLVTLIGLISKHGILIVKFANELQIKGKTKREAIQMASSIRLRPILMTTAAMVLGVIPLIVASGAGAASRFNIGVVIASGISIGTLFTLFVVPAVYMLLADNLACSGKPS